MKKQDKIDDIRKWMKELQNERYAIENAALKELEEYVKQLYLTVLCTLVQYHNEQTEEQMLLLRRIICGMGVEDNVTEYMRKALEIDETQMQEFRSMIGDGDTKYYFAIDALLLAVLGSGERDTYEYLAELLELLDIHKRELECLCTVAKAIVMQNSEIYDEAKDMMSEQIHALDFSCYLSCFYEGAIIDSKQMVCYQSPNKETATEIKPRNEYLEKKVIFSNMKLKCDEDWKFQGNEEVIFENCTVVGGASSLYLNGCRHVEFNGCKFLDFTRSVLFEEGEGEVVIENCEFENCSVEYNYAYSPSWWTFSAGVIITSENGDNSIRNKIVNSDFRNCEVRNMDVRKGENIISDCECVVKNNRFYKCKSWFKRESRYLTEYTEARMFSNCIEPENNQLVDSAKFLG